MSPRPPYEVYFDFDNTITGFDVLDEIIRRFSINENWKRVEDDWEAGKIGSRECLERQLAEVRFTPDALHAYLATVKVDPYFPRILALLRERGIEPVIVSDSFTQVISAVLQANGIRDLRILANEMRIDGDRPVVSFPFFHSICTRCGNCKTSHLFRRDREPGTTKIYAGDGRSDICPAGFCDILFAKGSLLRHYSSLRPDCIPFENLEPVFSNLQRILK